MQSCQSVTRFAVARFVPCACDPGDEWIHGFTTREGKRDGMYLAARRVSGKVRWLDVALSAGSGLGSIAVRAWIDLETRMIQCRVLSPNEVEAHPALALGGWLNKVEVSALGADVHQLTMLLVVGYDRLAAHLFDLGAALSPTALAAPMKELQEQSAAAE